MRTCSILGLSLFFLSSLAEAQQICFEEIHHHVSTSSQDGGEDYFELLKGCVFPEFNVKTVAGEIVSPEDLKNKVVVMNFWNIDHKSSTKEIPLLNRLAQKYLEDDVVFLSFNNNSRQSLLKFLAKNECRFHVVAESHKVNELLMPEQHYPTNMIFNRNGELMYGISGDYQTRGKTVEEALSPLIDKLLIATH